MMRGIGGILLSVLLVALAGRALADDGAFLIIDRAAGDRFAVEGRNLTVEINVWNAGDGPALNVVVEDASFTQPLFQIVGGEFTGNFETIGAGEKVTHSFTVVPQRTGQMKMAPAVARYQLEGASKDFVQEVKSPFKVINVIAPSTARMVKALTIGAYISLGSMRSTTDWRNFAIAVAVISGSVGAYVVYNAVSKASKAAKRRSAQKALEDE
ncbi:unnamed protein product [Pedinophyceae sp. YPF-701]|nr:unnamed protein product [Pedinophyceae sp. YPF-701]